MFFFQETLSWHCLLWLKLPCHFPWRTCDTQCATTSHPRLQKVTGLCSSCTEIQISSTCQWRLVCALVWQELSTEHGGVSECKINVTPGTEMSCAKGTTRRGENEKELLQAKYSKAQNRAAHPRPQCKRKLLSWVFFRGGQVGVWFWF